jgi:predicted component of type VI protein secretion system
MVELQETGYVTKQYEIKDRFGRMTVDVTLYHGRIYSITLHTGKRIELGPYDIRVVLEIIKRHPLPELPEEVSE